MADKRHWVIGRAPDCDVVMSQSDVSGKHCRLSRDGTSWMIEDLGSSNGTFVNGKRLAAHSPVAVHHGDTITLGTSALPWPERPPAGAPRLARTVLASPAPEPAAQPRSGGGRTPVPEPRSHPSRPAAPPAAPGLNWGVILGALAFVVLCIGGLTAVIMMSGGGGDPGKDGGQDKDNKVASKDDRDKDGKDNGKVATPKGGWLISEDFITTHERGDALPKGWKGKGVAVMADQNKRPCMEATLATHAAGTATLPSVDLNGDFTIEGDTYIYPSVLVLLEGEGPRIAVKIDENGVVKVNDNAPKPPPSGARHAIAFRIARKGSTLHVFINESQTAVAPLEKHTTVNNIGIGLETWGTGYQPSRLYQIKVKGN